MKKKTSKQEKTENDLDTRAVQTNGRGAVLRLRRHGAGRLRLTSTYEFIDY